MVIKGLQKLTLLDYPGEIAATVFLGGCNFRCPFCHNGTLVLGGSENCVSEEELFTFLESRRTKLGAVCISGGEPTLHKELPDLIRKIKDMGFLVKLDTNGTNPRMIKELVSLGLIDYVAMDVKSSPEKYALVSGDPDVDLSAISESIEFLLTGAVEYEFRTTVVRELHSVEDFAAIGEWIQGARAYFLQPYKDSADVIEKGFSSYSEAEILELLDVVFMYVPNAQIRG